MEKAKRWLGGRLKDIRAFIADMYECDLPAKRVDALAGATLGVMTGAALVMAMIGHGRATPPLWLTVWKEELSARCNDYEDACLVRLSQVVLPGSVVTILADRGFGGHKLFAFLDKPGFGYVIRAEMPEAIVVANRTEDAL